MPLHLTIDNIGNEVLVNSASDLPAPSGGVITLASNTVYRLMKDITITDQINLNGSAMVGGSLFVINLTYTPNSGDMFTGSEGGHLENLLLSANGGGTSQMFNLDSDGTKNLLVRNCSIVSSRIGTIKDYNIIQFQLVAFGSNTLGITFNTITSLLLNQIAFSSTNTATTFVTLTGAFTNIQIIGGIYDVPSTQTGISITGVSSVSNGNVSGGGIFQGAGTYISGTFDINWHVVALGLSTQTDEVARGDVYISTPAATAIAAQNTPIKVAGTTTAAFLFRTDENSVSNRIRYLGKKTRDIRAIASISLTAAANNKTFNFYIYKNGSVVTGSKMQIFVGTGSDVRTLSINSHVTVAQNDYVELWVENATDDTDLTVQFMNLSIK